MNPEFLEKANCKGYDIDLFYPEKDNQRKFPPKIYKSAKNICAKCPVMMDCLEHALENDEILGVWGGKSPNERRAMYIKLYGYEAWAEVRNGLSLQQKKKT